MSKVLFEVKNYKELTDEEVAQIAEVFNETFSSANPLGCCIYRDGKIWRERYGTLGDVEVALAIVDGRIVGTTVVTYKTVYVAGEKVVAAFIDDVAVLPKYQGRGLGKGVFSKAMEAISERNPAGSVLYTSRKIIAWKMYRKFGFEDFAGPYLALKIFNKSEFAKRVKSWYGFIIRLLPLSTKVKGGGSAEKVGLEAISELNEIGSKFNLFAEINEDYVKRTELYKSGRAFGAASLRPFFTLKGNTTFGLISTLVYEKVEDVYKLIPVLARRLKEGGAVVSYTQFIDGNLVRPFKKAGYMVLSPKRTGLTAMARPFEDKDFVRKISQGRIYAPVEHMLGDW